MQTFNVFHLNTRVIINPLLKNLLSLSRNQLSHYLPQNTKSLQITIDGSYVFLIIFTLYKYNKSANRILVIKEYYYM